jgi:7-cyano-7-deazaguanine synthase in queuosine biosynthesis
VHLGLEHLSKTLCANAPPVIVDLLELAAYVYTADQATTRGGKREFEYGSHWRRHFRFEVPVRRPDLWVQPAVTQALTETLGFLSDDDYEFGFVRYSNPPPMEGYLFADGGTGAGDFEEVMLFSGGLDSLGGAVQEVLQGQRKVALVSHRPVNKIYTRQSALATRIAERVARSQMQPLHVAVRVNKGKKLSVEFSQRCRSFLFASVAAFVARLLGLWRIRFYENGVVSLNLPLSPQALGARASRTTHPQTLHGFGQLFTLLFESNFTVENPFLWKTKTTVLQEIQAAGHADLCALTGSCGHTFGQTLEHPHCGRCSQCVDRRLTALGAGLSEREDPASGYASDVLTGELEGDDLILAERYFGCLLEVERLEDPRSFLSAYPELSRVLRYVDESAGQVARRAHELYRLHAEQIRNALARAVSEESASIVQWQHPLNCLLSIVCGRSGRARAEQESAGLSTPVTAGRTGSAKLVVDKEMLGAHFQGKTCFLGNSKEFDILLRLNRRPGRYVTVESLSNDVWPNQRVEKNTIQRTISNLRRRLVDAGFCIQIDGKQRDNYRLVLPQ